MVQKRGREEGRERVGKGEAERRRRRIGYGCACSHTHWNDTNTMKQSGMPSCHICRVMGKAQPRKNPQRSSSKACINFIHNTSRKVSDVSFFSFGARHAGLAFWVLWFCCCCCCIVSFFSGKKSGHHYSTTLLPTLPTLQYH